MEHQEKIEGGKTDKFFIFHQSCILHSPVQIYVLRHAPHGHWGSIEITPWNKEITYQIAHYCVFKYLNFPSVLNEPIQRLLTTGKQLSILHLQVISSRQKTRWV